MPKIEKKEFRDRLNSIQGEMKKQQLDLCLVYGDEYRKEYLRYVSNYWPIFEQGATLIPAAGAPILACAAECEKVAREMSVWDDVRVVPDFACVTVPDEIEFPVTDFTSFQEIFRELNNRYPIKKMGIIGIDAMPYYTYQAIKKSLGGVEIVDVNSIINKLRLKKSKNEIACLREANRLADIGYLELMKTARPGVTELEMAAAAEGAARKAGAEDVVFTVMGTGPRTETIVGRPTERKVNKGDMVMTALGIQYEGYVATTQFPFVVGFNPSEEQKELLDALIKAAEIALDNLGPGVKQSDFVKSVKDFFRGRNLDQYDVYPPLHGCGCAEAESPYPNESSEGIFEAGMTVNTDISLFGHPAGSNRIEEGFAITDEGIEPFSKLVRACCQMWSQKGKIILEELIDELSL